jgi:hypothetical protein
MPDEIPLVFSLLARQAGLAVRPAVSLTHPQLLLLELVEHYGARIEGIANGGSWIANNTWFHPYPTTQWAAALQQLAARGLICFHLDHPPDMRPPVPIDRRSNLPKPPSRQVLLINPEQPASCHPPSPPTNYPQTHLFAGSTP